MASPNDAENNAWKFPQIKTIVTALSNSSKSSKGTPAQGETVYYGVYFYPYTKPGDDPVFAVIGGQEVIIARPNEQTGIETIRAFRDDVGFGGEAFSAACWTRDKRTGVPLLAVGGSGSVIKILDVVKGECVETLSGHGEELMDLMTSPVDQDIIATTGADTTIRVWSLDPKHRKQPCSIICDGQGHRETVLTIAFHHTGRYLLSGGMDHLVNLWVIPANASEAAGTDKPLSIMYPHFSTAMIHSNYVDCVAFHGDYIISKSANENKIVLWMIQNFNSKLPPPSTAPTNHDSRETRSAFGGSFERLMQFQAIDTEPFFMRFGFFTQPGLHPLLAMGNCSGRVFLWDLFMIEAYARGGEGGITARESGTPPERGGVRRDDVGELFGMVRPHCTLDIKQSKSTIRHIAFSMDGRYMVVVGENSNITICRKW